EIIACAGVARVTTRSRVAQYLFAVQLEYDAEFIVMSVRTLARDAIGEGKKKQIGLRMPHHGNAGSLQKRDLIFTPRRRILFPAARSGAAPEPEAVLAGLWRRALQKA